MKIQITVKLFASLRKYGFETEEFEIEEECTIQTIINQINLSQTEENLIFLVNGLPHRPLSYNLKDGDTLAIFPQIGGG